MLFFQSVLLLGYLYARLSTRMLPVPVQVGLHMSLQVIPDDGENENGMF
ncbi:hypothetical protein [Silicimonas algicola]|uniref:Uncharacterized protein n=1 Tax=Silicimonas algicola TaxID=1826607 RepID=A0A316G792_9RHOB|nr:hypothetical protein [Silicimonas algicola]PWK56784.1 hypothetical protein C8D95_10314 [Silicimonas algicola]